MTLFSKAVAACALMILLGIGALSFRSTARDEEDRGWVTHTHLVLEKLQAILIDVTQAETGQRGYILTGQEKYLKPYQAGIDRVHRDMEEVRKLTIDNPRQQDAIKNLEPVIDARLRLLVGPTEIRRQTGLTAAAEAVAKEDGEELMNEVRERISEMRLVEERLLEIRMETAAASTRKMKAVIVLGDALAVLILSVAGFVVRQEANRRNLAEKGLKQVNEHLEHRTAELSDANSELETFS